MNENIIKKLGITPGPWSSKSNGGVFDIDNYPIPLSSAWMEGAYSENRGASTKESKANDNLIAAAPEMLEALIDELLYIEDVADSNMPTIEEPIYIRMVSVVEKATGKSWDQLKELLK